MLGDFFGERIGLGQIVEIGHRGVLEPEHVEAGLVALQQLFPAEGAPAAIGCRFAPGFLAEVSVQRMVAVDEIAQVVVAHRFLFERVVDVGAVVVVPDLGGLRVRAGGAVVEEDHIRLDALGVEDAGWQPQNGVQIGGVEQLAADRFARAALEQHVVRHDDGGAAGCSQHRADVLHEIQLLV